MALKLPSLQFDYQLAFSGDPALDLPDPTTAPDDQREAVAKERLRLLEQARETGQWPVFAGQQPTWFKMRSIHGDVSWIRNVAQRDQLNEFLYAELAFRAAVTGIENLGMLRVERLVNDDGIMLVTKGTVDAIKAIGVDVGRPDLGHAIVVEIGLVALGRAMSGIGPKP